MGAALGFSTIKNEANAGEAGGSAARTVSGGLQGAGGRRGRGRGSGSSGRRSRSRGRGSGSSGRRSRSRAGVSIRTAVSEEGVAASAAVISLCTCQSGVIVKLRQWQIAYRSSAVSILGAALGFSTVKNEANALVAVGATAGSVGGDGARGGGGRTSGGRDCRGGGGRGTGSGVTVPVGLRLIHALTHGDTLEATCLQGLDHGNGQVEGGKLVNVVANSKLASSGGLDGAQVADEVVLSDLDLLRSKLVVVIGVQVEVRDDITQVLQDVLADSIARRVGRAHVGGVFADDVADSHLVLDHLVINLSLGDLRKILVGPSVGSNLVTLGYHALNNGAPVLVNSTLANVDTSDKEGGLETGGGKLVKNPVGVDVWAVIVGNSYSSGLAALVDTSTTVLNVSLLRTSIVASAGSNRSLVGITTRTEVEQAVRRIAVLRCVSTVSLLTVSIDQK